MVWTERHAFQSVGELDHTWEIDKSSLWFYASVSYLGSCACIPRRDVVAKNCILRAQPVSWVVDLGTFTKSLLWLPYQITTNLGASNNDLISYSSAGQKSGIRFTAPNLRRHLSHAPVGALGRNLFLHLFQFPKLLSLHVLTPGTFLHLQIQQCSFLIQRSHRLILLC